MNGILPYPMRTQEEKLSEWQTQRTRLEAIGYDSNAPGRELEEVVDTVLSIGLSWRKDIQALLEAVAQHPNTPAETLLTLLDHCPVAVGQNPALSSILLEVPDLFSRLSEPLWRQLLRAEAAPASLVSWLTVKANLARISEGDVPGSLIGEETQESLREEAELHIALAGEGATVEEWQNAIFEPTFWRSEEWSETDQQDLWEWIELGLVPPWICPAPPGELLQQDFGCVFPDDSDALRRAIPPRAWRTIRNPDSSFEDLTTVVSEFLPEGAGMRRAALRHPNANPALYTIARSAKATRERQFSPHLERLWRFALISADAPEEHLEGLVRTNRYTWTSGWKARLAVALSAAIDPKNPAHQAILTELSHEGNRLIRAAARKRLDEPSWHFTWPAEPPTAPQLAGSGTLAARLMAAIKRLFRRR